MNEAEIIKLWKGRYESTQKQFKSFIATKGKKGLKTLNIKANALHQKFFEGFDCLQCAGCCKGIPPILNTNDISKISKSLKENPADFENKYTTVDKDGDRVFACSPCVFLEETNACKIYDLRPKACKEYPHTDQHNFENLSPLHLKNIAYCPAVWFVCKTLMK